MLLLLLHFDYSAGLFRAGRGCDLDHRIGLDGLHDDFLRVVHHLGRRRCSSNHGRGGRAVSGDHLVLLKPLLRVLKLLVLYLLEDFRRQGAVREGLYYVDLLVWVSHQLLMDNLLLVNHLVGTVILRGDDWEMEGLAGRSKINRDRLLLLLLLLLLCIKLMKVMVLVLLRCCCVDHVDDLLRVELQGLLLLRLTIHLDWLQNLQSRRNNSLFPIYSPRQTYPWRLCLLLALDLLRREGLLR